MYTFIDNGLARIVKGRTVIYYAYAVIHPDLFGKYFFIQIERNKVRVVGTHQNFPNYPDSILWSLPYEYFESIVDILERNRPIWVDSARHHIGAVLRAPLFQSLPHN